MLSIFVLVLMSTSVAAFVPTTSPTGCGDNQYNDGGTCRSLTDCVPGEYISKNATPTSDRECAECWYTYTTQPNSFFCRWYPAMLFGCARKADDNDMLNASDKCYRPATLGLMGEMEGTSSYLTDNFNQDGSFSGLTSVVPIENQIFVGPETINTAFAQALYNVSVIEQCQMWQSIDGPSNIVHPYYIPAMGFRSTDPYFATPSFSSYAPNMRFNELIRDEMIEYLFYSYVLSKLLADGLDGTYYAIYASFYAPVFYKNFGLTEDNRLRSLAEYRTTFGMNENQGLFCGCHKENFLWAKGDFTEGNVNLLNVNEQNLAGGTDPNNLVCIDDTGNQVLRAPFNPDSYQRQYFSLSSATTSPTTSPTTRPTTSPTSPPTSTPYQDVIECGETFSGSTSDSTIQLGFGGTKHIYNFTLTNETTVVSFDACESDEGTRLFIYNQSNTTRYLSYDGGYPPISGCSFYNQRYMSLISSVLPAGSYMVVVESKLYLEDKVNYTLSMSCEAPQPLSALSCNSSVSGHTGTGAHQYGGTSLEHIYPFNITERTAISLDGCNASYDIYLRIYNEDMTQQLRARDDGGCPTDISGFRTRIDGFVLEPGTYNALVESSNWPNTTTGQYTLGLTCIPDPQTATSPTTSPTTGPSSPTTSPTTSPSTNPSTSPTTSPTTSPSTSPTTSPTLAPTPICDPNCNLNDDNNVTVCQIAVQQKKCYQELIYKACACHCCTLTPSPTAIPTESPSTLDPIVNSTPSPTSTPTESPSTLNPIVNSTPTPKTTVPLNQLNNDNDDIITSTAAIIAFSVGGALILCAVFFFIFSSFYKKSQPDLF